MLKPWYITLGNLVVIITMIFQVLGPLSAGMASAQTVFDDPLSPSSPANNPPANPPSGSGQTPANGYEPFNGNPNPTTNPTPTGDTGGATGGGGQNPGTGYVPDTSPDSSSGNAENGTFKQTMEAIESRNTSGLYEIMIQFGGFFAGLGGIVFDLVFDLTVNRFGCLFRADGSGCSEWNGQIGGVVNELWKVIRDLFNIIFIFSLVYIGLRLILKSDDSSTQKSIGLLIAAALLVNFSLYIAKLIVDIANFTAVQIHSSMTSGLDGSFGIDTASYAFSLERGSITGAFMEVLRIASWFGGEGGIVEGTNAIVLGIITFIFLAYLGFIFLYGALMLITRLIALIILLIFSPMMFLGWVLPQFQKYSSQWMAMFIGYSFYIPAYVFLLYMSLFVMIQFAATTGGEVGYADAVKNNEITTGAFSIYVMYFVGAGLLFASTKVAGIISKSGAGATMSMAGNFANKASMFAPRLAGRGAQWTGGRVLSSVWGGMNQSTLDKIDEKERRTGKTSSWDRTRRAWAEKQQKKSFGASSYADRKDQRKTAEKRAAGAYSAQTVVDDIINGSTSSATPAQKIAYEKAIQRADKNDILNMAKTESGRTALLAAAGDLSEKHIEALNESDDVKGTFKSELNGKRKNAVANTIGINAIAASGSTPAVTRDQAIKNISKADKSQLGDVGVENLEEGAMYLQDTQIKDLEDLVKNGKLAKSQLTSIKEKRKKDIIDSRSSVPKAQVVLKTRRGKKEIAKLPEEFLHSVNFIKAAYTEGILNTGLLDTIAKESGADTKKIGENIRKEGIYTPGDSSEIDKWTKNGVGLQFS